MEEVNGQTMIKVEVEIHEGNTTTTLNAENNNMENDKTVFCEDCQETPCVWVSNKEEMAMFDDATNGLLTGADLPPSNLRRKPIYRQMALIIAGGPTGKGICMVHPKCVVQGIRSMFPAEDGKYMGHMEN